MAISVGEAALSKIAVGPDSVATVSIADSTVWSSFTPFNIENQDLIDEPTPNCAGAWVTLNGGGSAGLQGVGNHVAVGRGGGAGGAKIERFFVPRNLMGDTYSTTQGKFGATTGAPGTAATFITGSVVLSAGGGAAPIAASGGSGGTCSVVGVTGVIAHSGTSGGSGTTSTGSPGTSNPNGAGAGGGAGGTGNLGFGGAGGDSATVTGGARGAGNGAGNGGPGLTPADAAAGSGGAGAGGGGVGIILAGAGHGGAGGKGGKYGGGGGAGGNGNASGGVGGPFGPGGVGYNLIEWVIDGPAQIAPSLSLTEVAPRYLSVAAIGYPADAPSIVAGFNFYLNGVQNNTSLQGQPIYTFTGLAPSTAYTVTATVVGTDGTESSQYASIGVTTSLDDLITADQQAAVDVIAKRAIAAVGAPGSMVMVNGPAGSYTKTYGGLNINGKFRIASVTKTFTGTAVLMALDKGLISLDDKLSKYLPGYSIDPTIKQIMMMRSGLFDYELYPSLGLNFTLNPTMAESVAQLFAIIKAGAPAFQPGDSYQYTNSNYYVLAAIVEAVDPDDRTIDEIFIQDIITPLGLSDTTWPTSIGMPVPPIHGYDNGPLGLGLFGKRDVSDQNPNFVYSAGAIISTMADLTKWTNELRDGTLLSPETHELRKTTFASVALGGTARYGFAYDGPTSFGYGLGFIQVGSWFGHDGSWLGYDCCVMFEPETGATIVVMENQQTGAPYVLASLSAIWYEIATLLYPGSTAAPGYKKALTITPTGIPSAEAFGTVQFLVSTPKGDQDGVTTIPHKVPFTI